MSTERNSECSSVIENKNFFHFRQAMAEDERVDLVSFTGSTPVKFICCVPNYFMSALLLETGDVSSILENKMVKATNYSFIFYLIFMT